VEQNGAASSIGGGARREHPMRGFVPPRSGAPDRKSTDRPRRPVIGARPVPAAGRSPVAAHAAGGLPERLQTVMEAMSGFSLADVVVHRNSAEPARLGAAAVAQGSQNHSAPGQERHLSREGAANGGGDAPIVQAMCDCPDCDYGTAIVQQRATRGHGSDPYEVEADRVADLVMSPVPPAGAPPIQDFKRAGGASPLQKATDEEEAEEAEGNLIDAEFGLLMKAASDGTDGTTPFLVPSSGGQPLPAGQRSYLEPRFGRDFSSVRLHTGSLADASARSVGALAYTRGDDIVFRSGEYSQTSANGGWLLAHELTHVAQQRHAPRLGPQSLAVMPSSEGAVQRFADPTLPTRQPIDAAYAHSLSNDELDAAIAETQHATERENQSTPFADALFENLAILKSVRFERNNRTEMPKDAKPPQVETDAEFTEAEFDVEAENWTAPSPVAGIVRGDPASLRDSPSKKSSTSEQVSLNTRLVVLATQDKWCHVELEDRRQGWIDSSLVETKLPDPDARLHVIKPRETAQGIARHYYGSHSNKWGQDERFFVNVLYYTNQNFPAQINTQEKNIYLLPGRDEEWEAVRVQSGSRIWIPGADYALGLKGIVSSGSITYEAWQTIKNIFVGVAAFIAGLLVGALESVVDVFVGVWDLVKMAWTVIKKIVTGQIISDVRNLWGALSGLNWQIIENAGVSGFKEKWNRGTWPRWYGIGWLVGYAVVEILMLIFSAGIATAVKWAGKAGKIAGLLREIPTIAKMVKKAEQLTGPAVDAIRLGSKAFSKAHHWAQTVLRIPFEIIKDTSAEALERLKGLSAWAKEKIRHLNPFAMKACLGCASPCKVNIHDIEDYLKNLGGKGAKVGAKLGSDAGKILASLPAHRLNLSMIKKKLKTRPALAKLIEAAELTPGDMAKIADFAPVGGILSPVQSYRTFVRYLTAVVPAKTQGDVDKLNKIAAAMMKTDAAAPDAVNKAIIRQGSALKGSMFEGFCKLYLPELGGKNFARVTFKEGKWLKLEKSQRTADNFVEATGEIWEIKHTIGKVPADQARDYQAIVNQVTPSGVKVSRVNYLFPTEEAAKANAHLKDVGFGVHYVVGKKMEEL
jgi:hypothetical protein